MTDIEHARQQAADLLKKLKTTRNSTDPTDHAIAEIAYVSALDELEDLERHEQEAAELFFRALLVSNARLLDTPIKIGSATYKLRIERVEP